ncbi:unnamed protein product [Linum trigynum]|uniref:Uncharacterized protein n=1 Tax=Linum trigynum TaxID=586398 RepID=A0AAV2E8P3_9ROSI
MKRRSIPWRNGEVLNDSKFKGGLGFRNFHVFTLALLAKQGWRLLNEPEALWARLLRRLYFPNSDFRQARKGSSPSWIWASLWESKKTLDLGTVRVVGSGNSSWFHKDPWLPSLEGHKISTPNIPASRVSDWIREDTRQWN